MLPFQCTDFINALFEYLADERADIHVNTERVRERFLGDVRADRSRALSERTLVDLSPSSSKKSSHILFAH